jgi:hypothetical protein
MKQITLENMAKVVNYLSDYAIEKECSIVFELDSCVTPTTMTRMINEENLVIKFRMDILSKNVIVIRKIETIVNLKKVE